MTRPPCARRRPARCWVRPEGRRPWELAALSRQFGPRSRTRTGRSPQQGRTSQSLGRCGRLTASRHEQRHQPAPPTVRSFHHCWPTSPFRAGRSDGLHCVELLIADCLQVDSKDRDDDPDPEGDQGGHGDDSRLGPGRRGWVWLGRAESLVVLRSDQGVAVGWTCWVKWRPQCGRVPSRSCRSYSSARSQEVSTRPALAATCGSAARAATARPT